MKTDHKFTSELWLYPGETASWHFLTVPKAISENIKKGQTGLRRGWGSVPVLATIGKTEWKTSIFPDTRAGAYLLPVKADVRKKESLMRGDIVHFSLLFK